MENKKALNPTTIRLGFISFFLDVSSEMLYPITPIFLATVLGASPTSIGFIEGTAEAIASISKSYFGSLSDRWKRRKIFIVGGYLLSGLSKPFTGMSTSWFHVLLFRSMDRTGKGIRTAPRDALLADSVDPAFRGQAFGWHRLMDTMGAATGPLLAILFLTLWPNNLREIFYWSAIPATIAVGISLFLKELKPEKEVLRAEPVPSVGLTGDAKRLLFALTVFSLGNSSDVFLLLKARQAGVELRVVILLYCFYNLFYALLSPYLGKLADKIPRARVVVAGYLIFSFVYGGFAFAHQLWQFAILFSVYGIYMAATDGVVKALIVDLIPKQSRATALGVFGTVTGLATIIASTFAGMLWEHFGQNWPFIVGSCFAILAAGMLVKFQPKNLPDSA